MDGGIGSSYFLQDTENNKINSKQKMCDFIFVFIIQNYEKIRHNHISLTAHVQYLNLFKFLDFLN